MCPDHKTELQRASVAAYDNFYIRTLLGEAVHEYPIGSLHQGHLTAALRLLSNCDDVIVAESEDAGARVARFLGLEQGKHDFDGKLLARAARTTRTCDLTGDTLLRAIEDNALDVALYRAAQGLHSRPLRCAWNGGQTAAERVKMEKPAPAIVDNWLRAARGGYCNTTYRAVGCHRLGEPLADRGSWVLSPVQRTNWSVAAAACLQLCRGCPSCRFVTISVAHADCSWYRECNLDALNGQDTGRMALFGVTKKTFMSGAAV